MSDDQKTQSDVEGKIAIADLLADLSEKDYQEVQILAARFRKDKAPKAPKTKAGPKPGGKKRGPKSKAEKEAEAAANAAAAPAVVEPELS